MGAYSNNNIRIKLKDRLRILESFIEKEPIILISDSGDVWISEKAKRTISEKKINTNELIGWLKIGIEHLIKASYGNLHTFMVQLPRNPNGRDVLILLMNKLEKDTPMLTVMEKKVLKYLAKGLPNKEIATKLNIGHGTVNTHLDNIYRKLGVSNRVAALCTAVKRGLVVSVA